MKWAKFFIAVMFALLFLTISVASGYGAVLYHSEGLGFAAFFSFFVSLYCLSYTGVIDDR